MRIAPPLLARLTDRVGGGGRQERVSDDFIALVPFYVDFGQGATALLGKAPFVGNQTRKIDQTVPLPKKPKGFLVNANYENPSISVVTNRGSKSRKKRKK